MKAIIIVVALCMIGLVVVGCGNSRKVAELESQIEAMKADIGDLGMPFEILKTAVADGDIEVAENCVEDMEPHIDNLFDLMFPGDQ